MNVYKMAYSEVINRGEVVLGSYGDRVSVYGVPRGGMCALLAITTEVQIHPVTNPDYAEIILDDIIDSGATREKYALLHPGKPFVALVDKTQAADKDLGWVQFPWETETGPEDAIVRLIEAVGEDPKRAGLLETPKRVVKAYREMTAGYAEDPKEILSKVFDENCDEMVILRGIPFVSLCEHHLLPFSGEVDIGYIPGAEGRVVGLSKLARLVDCFARRFQVQERLTRQIATALNENNLLPRGVGVVVRAAHSCMQCRGVKKSGAEMVTSVMLGHFRDDPKARAEFMGLLKS